ncbi:hypothetical protein ACQY0O_005288 [Thecaphora frezii]
MWGSTSSQQPLRGSPSTSRRAGFVTGGTAAVASAAPLSKQFGGFAGGSTTGTRGSSHLVGQVRSRQIPFGLRIDDDTPTTLVSLDLPAEASISWRRYLKGKQRATCDEAGVSAAPLVDCAAQPASSSNAGRNMVAEDDEAAWEHALATLSRLASCERRARLQQRRRRRRRPSQEEVMMLRASSSLSPPGPASDSTASSVLPNQADAGHLLEGILFAIDHHADAHKSMDGDSLEHRDQEHDSGPNGSPSALTNAAASLWIYRVTMTEANTAIPVSPEAPSVFAQPSAERDSVTAASPSEAGVTGTARPRIGSSRPAPAEDSSQRDQLWAICDDGQGSEEVEELKRQLSDNLNRWTLFESGAYSLADAYPADCDNATLENEGAGPSFSGRASSLLPTTGSDKAHVMLLRALEDKLADLLVHQRAAELRPPPQTASAEGPAQSASSATDGVNREATGMAMEVDGSPEGVRTPALSVAPSTPLQSLKAPIKLGADLPTPSTPARSAAPAPLKGAAPAYKVGTGPVEGADAGSPGPSSIADLLASAGGGGRRAIRIGSGVVMLPLAVEKGSKRPLAGLAASPWPVSRNAALDIGCTTGALYLDFAVHTTHSCLVVKLCPSRMPFRFLVEDDGEPQSGPVKLLLLPSGKPALLDRPVILDQFDEQRAAAGAATTAKGGPTNVATELLQAAEGLADRLCASGVDRQIVAQSRWAICKPLDAVDAEAASFLWPAPLVMVDDRYPSEPEHDRVTARPQPRVQFERRKSLDSARPLHEVSQIALAMLQGLGAAPTKSAPLVTEVRSHQGVPVSPPLILEDENSDGDAGMELDFPGPQASNVFAGGDNPGSKAASAPASDQPPSLPAPTSLEQWPNVRGIDARASSDGSASSVERLLALGASLDPPRSNISDKQPANSMMLDKPDATLAAGLPEPTNAPPYRWPMPGGKESAGATNRGSEGARRPSPETSAYANETQNQKRAIREGDMFSGFGLVTEDDFSFFDDGSFDLGAGFRTDAEAAAFAEPIGPLQAVGELESGGPQGPLPDSSDLASMDALGNLDNASLEALLAVPLPTPPPPAPLLPTAAAPGEPLPTAGAGSVAINAVVNAVTSDAVAPVSTAATVTSADSAATLDNDRGGEEHVPATAAKHEPLLSGSLPFEPQRQSEAVLAAAFPAGGDAMRPTHDLNATLDTPRDGSSMSSLTDIPSLPGFTPCSLTSSSPAFGTNQAKTPRTPCSPNDEMHHASIIIEGTAAAGPLHRDRATFGPEPASAAYPYPFLDPPIDLGEQTSSTGANGTTNEPPISSKPASLVPLAFLPLAQQREQRRLGWQQRNQPLDLYRKYGQLGKFDSSPGAGGAAASRLGVKGGRPSSFGSIVGAVAGPSQTPSNPDKGRSGRLHPSSTANLPTAALPKGASAEASTQVRSSEEMRRLRISRFKVPFVAGARRGRVFSSAQRTLDARSHVAASYSETESSSDEDVDSESESEEEPVSALHTTTRLRLLQRSLAELSLHRRLPSTDRLLRMSRGLVRNYGAETDLTPTNPPPLSVDKLTTLAVWLAENPEFRAIFRPRTASTGTMFRLASHGRPLAPAPSVVLDLLPSFLTLVSATDDRQVEPFPAGRSVAAPTLLSLLAGGRRSVKRAFTLTGAALQQPTSEMTATAISSNAAATRHLVQPLEPPRIAVGTQGSVLQAAPTTLAFWEKLNLEAVGGAKHCIAKVLQLPASQERQVQVRNWLEQVGRAFRTYGLGSHMAASEPILTLGDGTDVGLATFLDTMPREIWLDTIGSIASRIQVPLRQGKHVVLYTIQSATSERCRRTGYRGLLRLDHELRAALRELVGEASGCLIVRPISPEAVTESGAVGLGSRGDGMRRFAFSLFDQLRRLIQRRIPKLLHPEAETLHTDLIQYPSFTIMPGVASADDGNGGRQRFEPQWPSPSPPLRVHEDGMLLHIAYDLRPATPRVDKAHDADAIGCGSGRAQAAGSGSLSPDGDGDARDGVNDGGVNAGAPLTIVSWTDQRAQGHGVQVWRTNPSLAAELAAVWRYALQQARRANVAWRIVICKASPMSVDELRAWSQLAGREIGGRDGIVSSDPHVKDVTIVCLDPHGGIALLPIATGPAPHPQWTNAPPTPQQGLLHDASTVSYGIYPRTRMVVGDSTGEARGPMLALRTSLLVHCTRRGPLGLYDVADCESDEDAASAPASGGVPEVHCIHLLQVYRRQPDLAQRQRTARQRATERLGHGGDSVGSAGSTTDNEARTTTAQRDACSASLEARLRDITKSYYDLHVVARLRQALPRPWSALPWHAGVVAMLIDYLS